MRAAYLNSLEQISNPNATPPPTEAPRLRPGGVAPQSPAADVIEDEDEIIYVLDLPGIRPEEIEVVAHAGLLHVAAERHFDKERRKDKFLRVERTYGAFARTFRIPEGVDPSAIVAEQLHGTLTIRLPKVRGARAEMLETRIAV